MSVRDNAILACGHACMHPIIHTYIHTCSAFLLHALVTKLGVWVPHFHLAILTEHELAGAAQLAWRVLGAGTFTHLHAVASPIAKR